MTFPNALHERPITPEERKLLRLFVIIWDNGAFHHSHLVIEWFAVHPCLMMQLIPAYSPFLNPIEEFFSAWRWKVYDYHPYEQMPLLDAVTATAEVQRNVRVGYGMQEDFSLSVVSIVVISFTVIG